MNKDRDWTVLFIGGASGAGKSRLAHELARFYTVNILPVDDIVESLKAMTTCETLPMVHYWNTGINWMDVGISGNTDWLINVSKEIAPGLRAVADNHIEEDVPVIIEGDFIYPEFTRSFKNPKVKSLFVLEPNRNQLTQNYLAREGGDLQQYRADISASYGDWLSVTCKKMGINAIESRPWDTVLARAIKCLQNNNLIKQEPPNGNTYTGQI